MLGLTLREEFRGKRLKGTAIELSNDQHTGATQIAAKQSLEITYPTHDLLKGIEAVGPSQGRPVVVIGERGLGNQLLRNAVFVFPAQSIQHFINACRTARGKGGGVAGAACMDGLRQSASLIAVPSHLLPWRSE